MVMGTRNIQHRKAGGVPFRNALTSEMESMGCIC
jgi:hypothetical protein